MRRTRVFAAAALAVAAASLPGCMIAVGGEFDESGERIRKLEERMDAAERRLGVAGEVSQ